MSVFKHLGQAYTPARPAGFLKALIKEANTARSPTFDLEVEELRARYQNCAHKYIRAELERRYPNTWEEYPMVNAGTVRQVAFKDARTYKGKARKRWLQFKEADVVEDVAVATAPEDAQEPEVEGPTPEQEERQEAFAEMLKSARFVSKMREIDRRRVITGCFVRIDWNPHSKTAEQNGRVRIEPFFPSQVRTIVHHCDATSLESALVIIADSHGEYTGRMVDKKTGEAAQLGGRHEKFYEVWHRTAIKGPEDGAQYQFGAYNDRGEFQEGWWRVELMAELSESKPLYGDGTFQQNFMPWAYIGPGEPDGKLLVEPGDELLLHARNQDVLQSDLFKSVPDNATPGIMLFGASTLGEKPLMFRNGHITPVPDKNAKAQEFRSDLSTVPMEIGRDSSQRLAINRRMNRGAYDPASGTPASGYARSIENSDEDDASEEAAELLEMFETEVILPKVTAVHDIWSKSETQIFFKADGTPLGDAEFSVDLQEEPQYESAKEQADRVTMLVREKLLKKADALIQLGIVADLPEAEEYLEALEEEARAKAPVATDEDFRQSVENQLNGIVPTNLGEPPKEEAKQDLKAAAEEGAAQ